MQMENTWTKKRGQQQEEFSVNQMDHHQVSLLTYSFQVYGETYFLRQQSSLTLVIFSKNQNRVSTWCHFRNKMKKMLWLFSKTGQFDQGSDPTFDQTKKNHFSCHNWRQQWFKEAVQVWTSSSID